MGINVGRLRLFANLAVIIMLSAFAGCGDGLNCPAGTVKYGNSCIAEGTDGFIEINIPDAVNDTGAPDTNNDVENSTADSEVLDATSSPDVSKDDSGTDPTVFPGGVIGKECQKASNCQTEEFPSANCANWINGYCTTTACSMEDGKTCPEGADCLAIFPNDTGCVVRCESNAGCRQSEGYQCKLLQNLEGEFIGACHEVIPSTRKGERGPAETCASNSYCDGSAGCLTDFEGGYCGVLTCSNELPCPDGTECVMVNDRPVCLKGCNADAENIGEECQIPQYDGEEIITRTCIKKSNILTKVKVGVCGSSVSGQEIGALCRNDTECLSSECRLLAKGTCNNLGEDVIFCVEDVDCLSGVCVTTVEDTIGFCTALVSTQCTNGTIFIETVSREDKLDGHCVQPCNSENPCNSTLLRCMYGQPKFGNDSMACVDLKNGDVGNDCDSDNDCVSDHCFKAGGDGTPGYCTDDCRWNGSCPFPTTCASIDGENKCARMCLSDADCPRNTKSKHVCDQGATISFCRPEVSETSSIQP